MLTPQILRTLHVLPARHPRGQPHLSAASGLVCLGSQGVVVADDEHHLGVFSLLDDQPLKLMRLLTGDLPKKPKERKRAKPDFESLCVLPAMVAGYSHGALLALGSGSNDLRHKGLLIGLDTNGLLSDQAAFDLKQIDLTQWYAPLHSEFADLNVEGCMVDGERLHLFQRGNKGDSPSAWISYALSDVLAWLGEGKAVPQVLEIRRLNFGQIQGVPLTPTDALLLPDGRWLVSAVAEDTPDSVQDGACVGSALVLLDSAASVLRIEMLQGSPKVEGLSLWTHEGSTCLRMVTDADDPALASQLLGLDAFW